MAILVFSCFFTWGVLILNKEVNGKECMVPTESCPYNKEQWLRREQEFNCTMLQRKYTCLLTTENKLMESCISEYKIPDGFPGCPVIAICEEKPIIVGNERLTDCPENKKGCPDKNHGGYTIFEMYKYPACYISNRTFLKDKVLNIGDLRPTESSEVIRRGLNDIYFYVVMAITGLSLGITFFTITETAALPVRIANVIIGALFIDDCKMENLVPVYLILTGTIQSVIYVLFNWPRIFSPCIQKCCSLGNGMGRDETETEQGNSDEVTNPLSEDGKPRRTERRVINSSKFDFAVSFLLSIVWQVSGGIWVYGIFYKKVRNNSDSTKSCHNIVFYYAFIYVTLMYLYLIITTFILILCPRAYFKDRQCCRHHNKH